MISLGYSFTSTSMQHLEYVTIMEKEIWRLHRKLITQVTISNTLQKVGIQENHRSQNIQDPYYVMMWTWQYHCCFQAVCSLRKWESKEISLSWTKPASPRTFRLYSCMNQSPRKHPQKLCYLTDSHLEWNEICWNTWLTIIFFFCKWAAQIRLQFKSYILALRDGRWEKEIRWGRGSLQNWFSKGLCSYRLGFFGPCTWEKRVQFKMDVLDIAMLVLDKFCGLSEWKRQMLG